jgi:hypothetical protein
MAMIRINETFSPVPDANRQIMKDRETIVPKKLMTKAATTNVKSIDPN